MANKDLFALMFEFELDIEVEIMILFELEFDKAKLRSKNCQKTGWKKFKQEARMGRDKKMDSPKNDRRGIKPRRAV